MQFFDFSAPTPELNLAMDEAILENAEAGNSGEVLRFWESPTYFVVLGYTNRAEVEVNVEECAARGIPMLRRVSGGGTVLQGPNCLNYALIKRIEAGQSLNVAATNDLVMETTRAAIEGAVGEPVTISGHTDLAIAGRKFSGNAQKRKRDYFLFHGTFLMGFDLELVQTTLDKPSKEPSYRQHRSHRDFICNLEVSQDALKAALRSAWQANEELKNAPMELAQRFIEEKYAHDEWNLRF